MMHSKLTEEQLTASFARLFQTPLEHESARLAETALRGAAIALGRTKAPDLLELLDAHIEEGGAEADCLRAFIAAMAAQGIKPKTDESEAGPEAEPELGSKDKAGRPWMDSSTNMAEIRITKELFQAMFTDPGYDPPYMPLSALKGAAIVIKRAGLQLDILDIEDLNDGGEEAYGMRVFAGAMMQLGVDIPNGASGPAGEHPALVEAATYFESQFEDMHRGDPAKALLAVRGCATVLQRLGQGADLFDQHDLFDDEMLEDDMPADDMRNFVGAMKALGFPEGEPEVYLSRAEFARQAECLAKNVSGWKSDMLSPGRDPDEPVLDDTLRRFQYDIRMRMAMIQELSNGV